MIRFNAVGCKYKGEVRMDCSIEVVRRNIRRFDDLEQGRNFFLEQMRGVARATIETAENIILIGATPFAKKIFKMREEIFPSKKVVLVDNRSELDLNWGGGYLYYVQGLMWGDIWSG